jgi:hypothetical protein
MACYDLKPAANTIDGRSNIIKNIFPNLPIYLSVLNKAFVMGGSVRNFLKTFITFHISHRFYV